MLDNNIIKYTLPDNHFLCAFIILNNIDVTLIDREVFNWQGLYNNKELLVVRRGNSLFNKYNQKKLKLIHFAGINDIDDFILKLPIDISSLILSYSVDDNFLFKEKRIFVYLSEQSKYFTEKVEDDYVLKIFDAFIKEIANISDNKFNKKYSLFDSYILDLESLLSLCLTKPNSDYYWNGLKCGGAYLEAQEYVYLRNIVSQYNIRSIVEIGAGETSILFNTQGINTLSIEPFDGPWLKKALECGCNAHLIEFIPDKLIFDEKKIADVLSSFLKEVDLIFIDSPVGPQTKSKILTQICKYIGTKYVLFNDAIKDSRIIFSYQIQHNLKIIEFFDTFRGMAFFKVENEKEAATTVLSPFNGDTRIDNPDYILDIDVKEDYFKKGETKYIKTILKNNGKQIYSSRFNNPVFLSYHWFDSEGSIVQYDGIRTKLPCDMYPGDTMEFEIQIEILDSPGKYILEIDLVQEGVSWFKQIIDNLPVDIKVIVE